MKNKIIKFSFVLSILSCQFLSAGQNGQSSGSAEFDASLVTVHLVNPSSFKSLTFIKDVRSRLQVAVDSGNLEIGSGRTVELMISQQEVSVVLLKSGKPVSFIDLDRYFPKTEVKIAPSALPPSNGDDKRDCENE
ncbi:MAG: hypothetical protein WC747_02005 [Candidatus Babeliales bacterium]|jgi:hypothetical protein